MLDLFNLTSQPNSKRNSAGFVANSENEHYLLSVLNLSFHQLGDYSKRFDTQDRITCPLATNFIAQIKPVVNVKE